MTHEHEVKRIEEAHACARNIEFALNDVDTEVWARLPFWVKELLRILRDNEVYSNESRVRR